MPGHHRPLTHDFAFSGDREAIFVVQRRVFNRHSYITGRELAVIQLFNRGNGLFVLLL